MGFVNIRRLSETSLLKTSKNKVTIDDDKGIVLYYFTKRAIKDKMKNRYIKEIFFALLIDFFLISFYNE